MEAFQDFVMIWIRELKLDGKLVMIYFT